MNTYHYIDSFGRIFATETRPDVVVAVDVAHDMDTEYYDHAAADFQPRISMPLTVDGTTVSGIPPASSVTITVGEDTRTVDVSGELTLSADLPGTYSVTVSNLQRKWLDTTVEVTIP